MNDINYRVSLDMFDVQSQTTIKAKKGDSACKINITLSKHGKIYPIGDGCRATFNAKKADGNFVYDNCTIEGDTIVYDFASSIDENGTCQISACEGAVECEVTLYKGDEQLTSPRFTLVIDNTVYNGEEIFSSPETDVLKQLINEATEIVDEIETKLENGEFKGEKGDKGDKGDKGEDADVSTLMPKWANVYDFDESLKLETDHDNVFIMDESMSGLFYGRHRSGLQTVDENDDVISATLEDDGLNLWSSKNGDLRIKNVGNPQYDTDAANRKFVEVLTNHKNLELKKYIDDRINGILEYLKNSSAGSDALPVVAVVGDTLVLTAGGASTAEINDGTLILTLPTAQAVIENNTLVIK